MYNKLCGRPPQYAHALCKLTLDLLILKVVSETRVTLTTSVPILVFLCLSVLDLGLIYATDRRQTDVRRASSLTASALWGGGIIMDKRTEVLILVFGKKLHDIYMMSIFRASLHVIGSSSFYCPVRCQL